MIFIQHHQKSLIPNYNALGASRVSFAPADLMEKMLGTKIGAATVFGTTITILALVAMQFSFEWLKNIFDRKNKIQVKGEK